MASKYYDTTAVMQIIGCVFNNPQLLDYTDKYSITDEDFANEFHKVMFGAIYKIHELGATLITLENLADFFSTRPKSGAIYKKENGIWVDMSSDEKYMQKVINNAEEIKIVGIIKRNEEAVGGDRSYGMIGYKGELMEHLIEKINDSEIAQEQLNNKNINVFTGREFSTSTKFDLNSLRNKKVL